MRIVLQRVSQASVSVSGRVIGEISRGFVALIGFGPQDSEALLPLALDRIIKMRVFADSNDKLNLALSDIAGGLLLIPNFTLYADVSQRRPGFSGALPPAPARELFVKLVALAQRGEGYTVAQGEFGADMAVTLTNDGPITIVFDVEGQKQ